MRSIIYIFICLLFLTSCESFFETTLELEEPEFQKQLNLNGVLSSLHENHKILVSKTVGLNEKIDTSSVDSAIVYVTYPDGSICDFTMIDNEFNHGFSGLNYEGTCMNISQEGEYKLTVDVPSENLEASSTVRLPNFVEITDISYSEDGGLNDSGDEVSAIDLVINDPGGQNNFYRFELYAKSGNFTDHLYLESNDALTTESANYSGILIADNQFDGENYKLRLLFYNWYSTYYEEGFTFHIAASTISEDQYLFDKKLLKYEESKDNPFASAIQLHDNIDGGIGIFALENTKEYEIE